MMIDLVAFLRAQGVRPSSGETTVSRAAARSVVWSEIDFAFCIAWHY